MRYLKQIQWQKVEWWLPGLGAGGSGKLLNGYSFSFATWTEFWRMAAQIYEYT